MIGRAHHRRVLLLLVLVVLVATGCDPGPRAIMAAARPAEDPAGLEIVFGHCRGESDLGADRILGIEVRAESDPASAPTTTPGDDPFVWTEGYDRVIWAVQPGGPTAVDSIVVGRLPAGFSETVPLSEVLPERVLVVVRSFSTAVDGDSDAQLGVTTDSLPLDPADVLSDAGVETREDFELRVRQDECGQDVPEWFGPDLTSFLFKALLVTLAFFGVVVGSLAVTRRRDPDDFEDPEEPEEPEEREGPQEPDD